MKVALSASNFDVKEVADILRECDMVYTTMYSRVDELSKLLCTDVRPIPCATESMYAWIREQYPADTEYVTFGDLFKIANAQRDKSKVSACLVEKPDEEPYNPQRYRSVRVGELIDYLLRKADFVRTQVVPELIRLRRTRDVSAAIERVETYTRRAESLMAYDAKEFLVARSRVATGGPEFVLENN